LKCSVLGDGDFPQLGLLGFGQGDRPAEGPENPLTTETLAFVFFAFGFALTGNGQLIVLKRNVEVLFVT
jgi:hypothetical protein